MLKQVDKAPGGRHHCTAPPPSSPPYAAVRPEAAQPAGEARLRGGVLAEADDAEALPRLAALHAPPPAPSGGLAGAGSGTHETHSRCQRFPMPPAFAAFLPAVGQCILVPNATVFDLKQRLCQHPTISPVTPSQSPSSCLSTVVPTSTVDSAFDCT